jgi:lipopolysaccharide export system protein LptA
MNKLLIVVLIAWLSGMPAGVSGQQPAKVSATPTATPKKERKQNAPKQQAGASAKPAGMDFNAGVTGPITTEIYADEAFFDSNKNVGVFRGHVKVTDPRFNLQSDKLTAFISKQTQTGQAGQTAQPGGQTGQTGEPAATGQGQGLEKAIAEGNVAVVRDRPDPNGGAPTHAVGRAETATYVAASGDVELKGNPRVQQGLNTHIGTSPDTVMVINQNGQLTTHGPSRTDIRQEPKNDEKPEEDKGEKKRGDKDDKNAGSKEEKKSPDSSAKP